MEVSGQRNVQPVLYCRERTLGINWIGSWVVLKSCSGHIIGEKSFASAGDRTPVIQSVVRH
jgi:hypothetical protein